MLGSAWVAGFDGVFAPAPTGSHCNPLIVVVMNFMKHMINPEAVKHLSPKESFPWGFLLFRAKMDRAACLSVSWVVCTKTVVHRALETKIFLLWLWIYGCWSNLTACLCLTSSLSAECVEKLLKYSSLYYLPVHHILVFPEVTFYKAHVTWVTKSHFTFSLKQKCRALQYCSRFAFKVCTFQ